MAILLRILLNSTVLLPVDHHNNDFSVMKKVSGFDSNDDIKVQGWLPQMSYSNQELNKQKCVLVLNKSLCDIRKHFKQLIRYFESFK